MTPHAPRTSAGPSRMSFLASTAVVTAAVAVGCGVFGGTG
jgi:hypothetical protein